MARMKPLTIVIKLGTSSIVHETTHQPLLSTLSAIVETVVRLRAEGHKVVLVSSGAIGVGLQRMAMPTRPKSLSGKQALAAIGQGRLIALWDNLFGQLGQPIAQVLLTRGDISDRTRYLNAVNTFKELLSMGVVPIVNENDTVSVSEIKFGDNDTLSAITSSMIHADYLFLFTDVDGLYTANPRKDPAACLIEVVESTAAIRAQVSTATLGSSLGTGGMETKLIAAEIAAAAGVATIITSSRTPASLFAILEYNSSSSSSNSNNTTAARPPHTLFTPSLTPLRDLKAWTRHTLTPAGAVVIDAGAHGVLAKRESGGRLLAAGVLAVRGAFASGQAVRILVRKEVEAVTEDAPSAQEEYVRGLGSTQPGTSQTAETSESSPPRQDSGSDIAERVLPLPEDDTVLVEKDRDNSRNQWEVEEVGRGLASYNSAQIEKVRGLNSAHLPQLLGYADSEYVVENVTIFVLP
ncbi:glutamate 5-kinase [Gloeopeniophorella convolvens]|nr:glutamate 5-kinase [Gloeopeniophorella convolvens]